MNSPLVQNPAGNTPAFTPGPWTALIWGENIQGGELPHHEIFTEVNGCFVSLAEVPLAVTAEDMEPDGKGGSRVCASARLNQRECEANARLIAAAPELLDALKALTKDIPWGIGADQIHPDWHAARAAIAKAEGRA